MPLFRGNAEHVTSKLIAAIYDAALDPAKWQIFVDAIQTQLDGVEPVLYVADTKSAMMETLLVSQQWGETFVAQYMAYYNAVNPWAPHLVNDPEIGQPIRGEQILSPASLQRTEFYNDFFKHWVKWTGVVGVVPYRDRNAFSCLGLHCSQRSIDQNWQELNKLAAELSSHIMRAIEISRQLQHGQARSASMERMLEELSSPALIVGADLRVRYANSAADAAFCSGILTLDSQGRIAAGARGRETKILRAALVAALAPIDAASAPSVIRLTRPGDDAEAMPLVVRVMPFGGPERDEDIAAPIPQLPPEPEALMLMTDPAAKRPVGARQLQQLFGLTSTEARLARTLAQGISLRGYADDIGIAEGTARVQLKSVFAKTSTHRQPELVALLSSLAGPFKLGD
jgi:DNA-binding CsgD family transcriptional regulator